MQTLAFSTNAYRQTANVASGSALIPVVRIGNPNSLATVTVVSSTPVQITAQYSSGNLAISGTGGLALGTYYVVGTTNLTTPMGSWPVVSTNQFDGSGNFSITVPIATTNQTKFFRIKQ